MDLLPSRVMGYSSGFINTAGQIAGVGAPVILGALIQRSHHYNAGFIFMTASATVSALLVITLQDPKVRESIPAAVRRQECEGSDVKGLGS
jgi:sugar phosphate permease